MTIIKDQPIASTHEDLHGERRTCDELRSLYDSMPQESVMYNQHSPASEPVARCFNRRFVSLDDGEYAILVDLEVYNTDLFRQMGGFSISYTTTHYSVSPDCEPNLDVLYNPLEFPTNVFSQLACKTTDGFQIDVVKWHQKAVTGAAIVVLKFIGTASAAWFIKKLLDGALNLFKERLASLTQVRLETSGHSTSFQLMIPVIIDGQTVEVLAEISMADFDRLGIQELTLPDAQALVTERIRGRNVQKAVLKVAADGPRWVLTHAITRDHKTLLFKDSPILRVDRND